MTDAYGELIEMMRDQGAVNNPEGILLAVMTGPNSCAVGDFKLLKDDLYISEHLTKSIATKVNVTESHTDKSTYLPPLKAGDEVLIAKITDTAYVILEKVVRV